MIIEKKINYKTLTNTTLYSFYSFILMSMEDTFIEIRSFVLRLMAGEVMDSPEDIEFYRVWRPEISKLLDTYSNDEFPLTDIDLDF